MGQFSWKCSKCNEQILSDSTRRNYNQAVLITPEKNHVETDYQGYGEFGGVDAYEWLGKKFMDTFARLKDSGELREIGIMAADQVSEGIRIVHRDCFRGEKYDQLANSESDPDQGWDTDGEDEDSEYGEEEDGYDHEDYSEDEDGE